MDFFKPLIELKYVLCNDDFGDSPESKNGLLDLTLGDLGLGLDLGLRFVNQFRSLTSKLDS